ncbi:MAG: phosphatidylserine decarboxylase family protein [Firmicutes bacterium HGW-Firmicutes-14]|jgi:phosphatidylserine decarboxylase|nr:MAG: phosphatidylserine decarboxylase family protein [Firmicutes bacterium HGW-Firmicutes-14]
MKRHYIIVSDAAPYLAVLAVLTAISFYFYPVFAIIPGILFFFTAFFFRNPPRRIPTEAGALVSPADGTVVEIKEIYEDRFIKDKAIKVSIFLSIFNVHLNRSPMGGTVKYRSYRPGRMVPAFKSHASDINEKNYVGIENGSIRVMVTQITGFIARRIVCWANLEDRLTAGEIFGLIKFGSCTELIMPVDYEVLVRTGQKVVGGETVIGRLKDEL